MTARIPIINGRWSKQSTVSAERLDNGFGPDGRPPRSAKPSASPPDPESLLRSKEYRVLLVFAAVIGVLVSLVSWGYLELIHYLQEWLYKDLPSGLGLSPVPTWWPLPILAVAAVPIAFAIARLPGSGGHKPAEGLKAGPPTQPIELPGVLLASLASIGFGMVLGPEAPLIALAGGLGILAVRSARKDAPDQVVALIAAAASFAAMSSLFGSPIVGAVIIIEAAGLGGAILPVILLPGLLAAGIGSLVFIGMGTLTGLSSSAYAIAPLSLPKYHTPTISAFGWTILLAAVVAVVIFAIARIGLTVNAATLRRPFVIVPLAALTVGALAIIFGHLSGKPEDLVLFSGQDTMGAVVNQAASFSQKAFVLFLVFKGLAYGVSLGSARGGPTFPAMFLGIVAGLLVRPPSWILRNACGGGADGSGDGLDPPTSLVLDHHRHGRLPGRGLDHPSHHRGGGRGLSGGPGLVGLAHSEPPKALIAESPSVDGNRCATQSLHRRAPTMTTSLQCPIRRRALLADQRLSD